LWLLRELGTAAFLVLLCVVLAAIQPAFLDRENIKNVLVQVSYTAIAAVGMTLVILSAGIDLSVGSVLAFSGCCGTLVGLRLANSGVAWIANSGLAVVLGISISLAVGALCGLVNGLLITRLSLPPFIMTLGMMSVARGLAFVVSSSQPVKVIDGMRQIARARPLDLPLPIILMTATFLIGWAVQRHTRVGRYATAIGGNEEAARLSGVRIDLYKIAVYTICGFLSAISGLIIAGRLAYMQPQEGDGFELEVIAAVVIGGTSLYGGEGSIIGTLLGTLIIGAVRNGLDLMGMQYNLQKIIIGAIIIAAVSLDVLAKRIAERKS
jgi:ribose/xylose/arabinose/galactoside ABC-type transport system permease subunit